VGTLFPVSYPWSITMSLRIKPVHAIAGHHYRVRHLAKDQLVASAACSINFTKRAE